VQRRGGSRTRHLVRSIERLSHIVDRPLASEQIVVSGGVDLVVLHLPTAPALPAALHPPAVGGGELHRVRSGIMARHLEHVDEPTLGAPHV
jgi:hypothetical protein